jgi:hypothetical protein
MIQEISNASYPAVAQLPRAQRPDRAAEGNASVVAASATRDIAASLSITTKEGDTFSISASFDATATYAGLRGRGTRGSAWSVSGSSQVSVQVQGSLSEQEMKDISRIVRTFLHDLRSMLKGRDVSVANVADGNPGTLQSVSATAQSNVTVTAVAGSITGIPGGLSQPRPGQPGGGDSDLRPDGDVDRRPLGVLLPLPTPTTFTPAPTPALA